MKRSVKEKNKAILLRREGKTYGEISQRIFVSKSTLSFWLRAVEVPPEFASRIQDKKLAAVRLGWEARRKQRIDRTKLITRAARKEVKQLVKDPLWLVGVALYWAEGHKEKQWRPGTLVTFTNMDVDTVLIFKKWSTQFLGVTAEDFVVSLYIHDSRIEETAQMREWWAKKLSVRSRDIAVYYKKSKSRHVRHNDTDTYHGVIRIRIKRSVDMNRKIAGWTAELVRSLKNKNKLA